MIFKTIIIVAVIVLILLLFLILMLRSKYLAEKIKVLKLKMYISLGKFDDAKKIALKLADKYPQNYLVHKILGQLYEKEGNISVALDEYIRAVELKNDDYDLHYKVASLLIQNEKKDEAVIMLQDLLKMKPDYLQATLLLGNILYDEERFKEAVSVYMSALRYNPTEYELYYSIAMAFTRLNDFPKAKEYYQRAAILNTYLFNGEYDLALIAMIQGELDEAERHLQKAAHQEDIEPLAYFYLAEIALLKDEDDKAVNYINLALELDKKIENKIKQQPLFAKIQDRIRIPDEPSRKINICLSEREMKINEYLEEMYSLVDSLNGGNGYQHEESSIEEKQKEELVEEKDMDKER